MDESPRPGATVAAFGQVTGSTAIQPNFAHDPPPELLVLILSSAAPVVQAQAGGRHPPPTAPTADPVKLIGCSTTHRARPMSQSRVKNYIIISISYGALGAWLASRPAPPPASGRSRRRGTREPAARRRMDSLPTSQDRGTRVVKWREASSAGIKRRAIEPAVPGALAPRNDPSLQVEVAPSAPSPSGRLENFAAAPSVRTKS